MVWWTSLCLIAAGNIVLWLTVARTMGDHSNAYVMQQLLLSGIYVAACAFRSVLPRVDLERHCLWNTPLSSIFLGRTVATVAELCFAAQCALYVLKLADVTGSEKLRWIGWAILPIIAVAQIACWHAVVSLNHLGHAVEEILWAAMVSIVAISLWVAWAHMTPAGRVLNALGLVCCAGASFVMVVVDVPMYLNRWRASRSQGQNYLPITQGLRDTLSRRRVVQGWNDWRPEVLWMTLYFSVGVWLSLAFVFA